MAYTELQKASDAESLVQSQEILNLVSNMQLINTDKVVSELLPADYSDKKDLRLTDMSFYRIKQLSYDEEYPRREAFENVLLALDNRAFNFVYILTGSDKGIDLCVGVVKNANENETLLGEKLKANNYGEIIANAIAGNFTGSKLQKLKGKVLTELVIDSVEQYKNAGVILGVPSINEHEDGGEYDFQGIDRLINSMLGLNWRLVIVCEPVGEDEILDIQNDVYELYNRLAVSSKQNLQFSQNNGETYSFSTNTSDTRGKNEGYNSSDSTSKGNNSEHHSSSKSSSYGKSKGTSESHTKGKSESNGKSWGSSHAVTIEIANKRSQEMMKYIDEELLERLKLGFSKGLFKTAVYYMAENPAQANRLMLGIKSLFQGNKSSISPLIAQKLDLSNPDNYYVLKNYQNRYYDGSLSRDALILLSTPFYGSTVNLGTYLTTKELSLLAGMPQKEVPGLSLRESVCFGLNEQELPENGDELIDLGCLVQKGRRLDNVPFYLNRKALTKHTFIAGTTGSGKTTTCHRLLLESKGVPFMVIEPAKTEYRTLLKNDNFKDLMIFTLGNETVAPFRINPFELIPGEIISAHVDMVKATFTSAFPMEASMPQLLEEAIYMSYEQKGWNIDTNENEIYEEKAFDQDVDSFPILSDLLENMRKVVEAKNFSAQMQGDYIGSLVSRLSNLTVGSKGAMLNCSRSIDFNKLADANVILEMEELKSPEDKALLMGFVLSRMAAVFKSKHQENNNYQHITLVEEAHRLLSKVDYGDSGSKKVAVETFTDLLAEVRKYGEGLIIVDQIPNKLASEVLKNTNTKIIHRILAKDDKEAVGDAMLMDDKQKQYLSALGVGETIVFTENTDKPVNVQIEQSSDTSEATISDAEIRSYFLEHRLEYGAAYADLEIVPYYKRFCEIANCLECAVSQDDIDQNKIDGLKRSMETVAIKHKEALAEVWKKLILRRERLTGRYIANGDNAEKRIETLLSFYTETFYKECLALEDVETNLLDKLGI